MSNEIGTSVVPYLGKFVNWTTLDNNRKIQLVPLEVGIRRTFLRGLK